MRTFTNCAVAALMAGGIALGASVPAQAGVGISVGIGGPAYYGYNYSQPCRFYFNHAMPAPARCYNEYRGFYGGRAYISSGFVFRDRDDFAHWRDRDDFRHWRDHDWGHDRDDMHRDRDDRNHDADHDH